MEVVRTSPQRVSEPARTIKQFVAAASRLTGVFFWDDFTGRVWSRDADPGSQASQGESAQIEEGASLFRANCSPCHGLGAGGGGGGRI